MQLRDRVDPVTVNVRVDGSEIIVDIQYVLDLLMIKTGSNVGVLSCWRMDVARVGHMRTPSTGAVSHRCGRVASNKQRRRSLPGRYTCCYSTCARAATPEMRATKGAEVEAVMIPSSPDVAGLGAREGSVVNLLSREGRCLGGQP